MAKYKIKNKTNSSLFIPEPVARSVGKGETIELSVPAAEMDKPAIHNLIRRRAIDVVASEDPAHGDGVELLPHKPYVNPDFFTPTAVVKIYVHAETGDDGGDGSLSSPFRTYQRAVDEIPDGYACQVLIESLGGVSDEIQIYINKIPSVSVKGLVSNGSYESFFNLNPSIVFRGARKRATDIVWNLTGNGSAIVDDGVTKQSQRSRVLSPSWDFDLSTQDHILMAIDVMDGLSHIGFHPIAERSDQETGSVVLCHSSGGQSQFNLPVNRNLDYSFYTLESSFANRVRILSNGLSPVEMSGFKFPSVVLQDVSTTCCKFLSDSTIILSRQSIRGFGNYHGGNISVLSPLVGATQDAYASAIPIIGAFQKNVYDGFVLIYGASNTTGVFRGNGLRFTNAYCDNSGYWDHEADTAYSVHLTNSEVRITVNCSFKNNTGAAFYLSNSRLTRSGGSLAGSAAAPSVVANSSVVTGFGSNVTIQNALDPGQEIKVGANDPIAFSDLPDNDFVADDGSKLPASQGCRAS